MSDDPDDARRDELDRFMDAPARGGSRHEVSLVLGTIGLFLLLVRGIGLAVEPWDLDASSPTVDSRDAECSLLRGAVYEIEVDGTVGYCHGAVKRCGYDVVSVAYDPQNPSRCRVAARVDGPSRHETLGLLFALTFTAIGLSGLAYSLSLRARRDALAGEPVDPGRAAQWRRVVWVAMGLSWLGIVVTVVFGWSTLLR